MDVPTRPQPWPPRMGGVTEAERWRPTCGTAPDLLPWRPACSLARRLQGACSSPSRALGPRRPAPPASLGFDCCFKVLLLFLGLAAVGAGEKERGSQTPEAPWMAHPSQWQWEALLTRSHLLSDLGLDSEASVVPAVGQGGL